MDRYIPVVCLLTTLACARSRQAARPGPEETAARALPAFVASPPAQGPLAFPGAEGFGAVSVGGRGGDVYHVTSLADAGPGSLREGLRTAAGPRTIVFDVSGTIVLQSILQVERPFVTIAGQTAPGEGITLRDFSLNVRRTHDVVVRHLRIRRGDVQVRAAGARPDKSKGLDAVSIDDSAAVIFDHVSLSWSCDELFGITRNRDVTVQWSLLAEPLGDPMLHPYGDRHAFGMNESASTLSIHHNLIANYVMRGPQLEANDALAGQGFHVLMEAVNNVLYDYKSSGSRYTTGIEDNAAAAAGIAFRFHLLKNLYLRDPGNRKAPEISAVWKHGVSDQVRVHVAGNIGPNRPSDVLDPWLSVNLDRGGPSIRRGPADIQAQMSDRPLFSSPVPITMHSPEQAYELILRDAGASIRRDAVDSRVLDNVRQRRFGPCLRSQAEVGGWPALAEVRRPAGWDGDGDGMPDGWERAQGLDAANPADGRADRDGDGYTNLEDYLAAAAQERRSP